MEIVKEWQKACDPEKRGSVRKEGNSTVGLWNTSKLIGGAGRGGGAGDTSRTRRPGKSMSS